MSKSAPIPFKPLNFEATAAAVKRVAQDQNIPALAFPQHDAREGEGAPIAPVAKAVAYKRLPVELPAYVIDDLKQRAFHGETTCRFIIMEALRNHGIHIADADMIQDRRHPR